MKEVNKKNEDRKKLKDEFMKFIMRGNVIDLAVGVIVGGAFSKIVSSLVDDVLMPIIGVISGGIDFTNLSFKIKDATINYGMFIQNIIDFLIIAVCIFTFIKIINNLFHKEQKKEEVKKAPVKTDEVILLEAILEEMKGKKKVRRKTTRKVKS